MMSLALCLLRQAFEQWPAACRVLAFRSVTASNRPIQNGLDPAPHATRRFCLCRPDGVEHTNDICPLDRLYRQVTDDWKDVSLKRIRPLRGMFFIAPCRIAVLLRSNV